MHPLFEKASGLTETIIAGAIEVHRDKGSGLIESIYEWCLTKEFELRGLTCVSQKLVLIEYKGFTREEPLRFDMLVEGVCARGSQGRREDSAHPQSTTPELHEIGECPASAAHQFP
jgi:hypothetical protein